MHAKVRKYLVLVETTEREMGRAGCRRPQGGGAAVIANPFAGRYADDLEELMQIGEELGGVLGEEGRRGARRRALGDRERQGSDRRRGGRARARRGDPASAPRQALRQAVEKGAAWCRRPRRWAASAAIDVPLGHKDAAFVRSHFDAIEVRVPDAPRADEIVVAVAVTDSGRPLPRVGGLTVDQIEGKDGLR